MNINEINAGSLAYVGDAIYKLIIRKYLISIKLNNVNKLQNEAIKYVSAKAQAKFLDKIIDANILTKEELSTVSRARNYKPNSKPKNTDIKTADRGVKEVSTDGYTLASANHPQLENLHLLYVRGTNKELDNTVMVTHFNSFKGMKQYIEHLKKTTKAWNDNNDDEVKVFSYIPIT